MVFYDIVIQKMSNIYRPIGFPKDQTIYKKNVKNTPYIICDTEGIKKATPYVFET